MTPNRSYETKINITCSYIEDFIVTVIYGSVQKKIFQNVKVGNNSYISENGTM